MLIKDAISQLQAYNGPLGLTLHEGASEDLISMVENAFNISLPTDFKTFYRFTDGFETVEDIFNMIPLGEIIENKNKDNRFWIAEYMIYSDEWFLEAEPENPDIYSIYVIDIDSVKIVLTNSLGEFIARFLKGGVFEIGGLYAWKDEIKAKLYGNTNPYKMKPLLWVYRECLKRGLTTKQNVIDRADYIIATEDDPHHFFIEISLSHDVNELTTVLSSINLNEDVMQMRAFLGVMYLKLLTDNIEIEHVILILDNFLHDERFTTYERNKMRDLIVDWDYLSDIMPNAQLKQKLLEDIKEFFNNYWNFNLHYHIEWEKTNMDLVQKFESMNVTDNGW